MGQGKVMITGATGFLGSAFLVDILQSGYTAHIVVRSEAKAKTLQQAPAITSLDKAAACKYFTVPDLDVPGALDEATAGTDLVVHCATPLPLGQLEDITTPTVACTLGALESARKAGSVKRVVLLSSTAAFAPPEVLLGGDHEPSEVFIGEKPNERFNPPYATPLIAYCAAKTAAYRSSAEWMENAVQDGVSFDIVSLAPAYVFGRHPLATGVTDLIRTSNKVLLQLIMGGQPPQNGPPPPKTLGVGVTLKDVVQAVHQSLDLTGVKTPESGPSQGFSSYLMANKFALNDVFSLIARKWPEEVKKGLLTDQGNWPSKDKVNFIVDGFRETFGFELGGLEEMLDAMVPQYLELVKKERAAGEAEA
ncbi:hypothetical protein N0V93_004345 [Gnomoniopsis smithogilvyi]|uniref:NAD-dependent epimerase/dehydratase domain-containing protein n=1 Tax=Gnomoniopsis smithogilvyi TaxID=1191159 RepID=A0A9W8YUJ1_9PEZI|nr:hypothetical protein N0V93_004345 [Gnomoniopsis smithogilvyi]